MSDLPSWHPHSDTPVVLPRIVPEKRAPTAETKGEYPWHGHLAHPPTPEMQAISEKVVDASLNGELPIIPQNLYTPNRTLERYSTQQLIDRERFVSEYLFDFNPRRAALRCGYANASAAAVAHNFMQEAGVQQLIREHMKAYDVSELTKGRVVAGLLKEATNESPKSTHAGRIAAWKILGDVVGVAEKAIKDDRPQGGVMVVPATPVEAEWENITSKSQEDLRNSVRD